MATVFQRKGSKVWVAALRVWSAERGRFVWVQKPTGTRDKAQAAGIAAMLEQASGSAKAGTMTREKALGGFENQGVNRDAGIGLAGHYVIICTYALVTMADSAKTGRCVEM